MKIIISIIMAISFLVAFNAPALPKHNDRPLLNNDNATLLHQGQAISRVDKEFLGEQKLAFIQAAIKIPAPREQVWAVFNDCERAANYVPGLKSCKILKTAPDKSWQIRRHVSKHSALLPKMVSEFKSHYQYPERIDFHIVGGNLKTNEGVWMLEAIDGGKATILHYQAHVAAKSIAPDKIIRKVMKKAIPKTMYAIRDEVLKQPLSGK